MSRIDEATENPNDKSPKGKPLDPEKVVDEEFQDEDEGDLPSDVEAHGIENSNDLTTP